MKAPTIRKAMLRGIPPLPGRVSLSFGPGLNLIAGPNGCGKSRMLWAMLQALEGRVCARCRSIFSDDGQELVELTLSNGTRVVRMNRQMRDFTCAAGVGRAHSQSGVLMGRRAVKWELRAVYLDPEALDPVIKHVPAQAVGIALGSAPSALPIAFLDDVFWMCPRRETPRLARSLDSTARRGWQMITTLSNMRLAHEIHSLVPGSRLFVIGDGRGA